MFEKACENKRQGFCWFLFSWLLLGIIILSLYLCSFISFANPLLLYLIVGALIIAYAVLTSMSYYAYLQIVSIRLDMKAIIKNSLIFTLSRIKTNIITFLITHAIIALLVLLFPISLILLVLCAPALVNFIICFNSCRYIMIAAVPADDNENQLTGDPKDKKQDSIFHDV